MPRIRSGPVDALDAIEHSLVSNGRVGLPTAVGGNHHASEVAVRFVALETPDRTHGLRVRQQPFGGRLDPDGAIAALEGNEILGLQKQDADHRFRAAGRCRDPERADREGERGEQNAKPRGSSRHRRA